MATFTTVEEYACALAFLWVWLGVIGKVAARSRLVLTPLELATSLAVLGSLAALCYPALSRSYEGERVDECRSKLERITEALLAYRSRHGVLPPARVRRDDRSSDSWRTLILPHLAAAEGQAAGSEEPDYCCPSHVFSGSQFGSSASYFAVTGAGTAWDALQAGRGEIGDDPAETILLLEELDRGFDWRAPRDLDSEEALRLLTQPVGSRYVHLSSGRPGYFEKPNPQRGSEGVNAAFADGSVRFLPLPLPERFAIALLTAGGGEEIAASEMETLWKPELNHGKVYSFGLFGLLCLLPGIRGWPEREKER